MTAAASGCSLPCSRAAAKRSRVASSVPGCAAIFDHPRAAFGQGAGLVDHQGGHPLQPLQRLGAAHQHAGLGAAADADHDRHRRGEAERAGAGDDQHADGGDQPIGQARLRPDEEPGEEGDDGDGDDGGHEPGGDLVGQALDRRPAALGLAHHLHDAGQQRVAADLLGAQDQRARAVEGAADHLVAGRLGDGHGFAGDHGFVDEPLALEHQGIHRHLLAGAEAQAVADDDRFQRHVGFRSVGADAARLLRRQIEQRADGAAGARAGAEFQHLAEQHQHDDHGGGFEIDADGAVMAAHRRREQAGRGGGGQAVEKGRAGADGDQREHVEIAADAAIASRARRTASRPRARRALPSRSCSQLESCCGIWPWDGKPRRCGPIARTSSGRVSRAADPEAPRHVGQFGIGRVAGGDIDRLQRHAADRAAARPDLADLRMHRAGVDRAGGSRARRRSGAAVMSACPWPAGAAFAPRNFAGSALKRFRQDALQK